MVHGRAFVFPREEVTVPQKLLKVAEAADVLSVSPFTLYTWARSGRVPVVKLGKALRFRPEDLAALVRRSRRPARRVA